MSDERVETMPTEVRASIGDEVFGIEWAYGMTGKITNALLRACCPCAGCQGHTGTIRYVPGGDTVLDKIEEVGSYALQFTWGDGHASGIYTFRYLRRLSELASDPGFVGARPAIPRGET